MSAWAAGPGAALGTALLAAAVLVWPAAPARARTATLLRPAGSGRAGRGTPPARPGRPVVVLAAAAVGGLAAGIGGVVAAAAVAATAAARLRSRRERRTGGHVEAGLVQALGLVVAELRAGGHPAAAVEAAASEAAASGSAATGSAAGGHLPGRDGEVARVLSAAAAAARLGGDVPDVLRRGGAPGIARWLGRVADAWALADRNGVPLAELLDAVRVDVEERARFAAEVEARLAGPRATAAVLAGLPLLGVLLGQAVGADPLGVLLGGGVGQVLLVVGSGLGCAGVLWSARIVDGAVPS